jgi:hypothetical protein
MTQEEINLIFELSITIHTNHWFKNKSGEDVQQWIREKHNL